MSKKIFTILSILVIASMALAACGQQVTTEVVKETQIVKETELVKETEVVTVVETQIVEVTAEAPEVVEPTVEASTRKGGWFDQIVVVEEPSSEAGVKRLEAGEIDLYAFTIAKPDLLQTVQNSDQLDYQQSFGSFNEMTLNPVGPTFEATGKLNPFGTPAIREAVNWMIDRNYIAQEVTGGMAVPRFYIMAPVFADYARYADIAAQWETYYAYDLEKARTVISAEMETLGATLVDGKWNFNDEPVTLIGLIRVEDERVQIGDYFSNQLEELGFTVDRQYKTSAEASPIWTGNPNDGLWHFYTAGWISTSIPRTEEDDFANYYMPEGWPGNPLWDAYTNTDPAFREAALKLYNREYTNLEERRALFEECIPASMKDSVRIYTSNRASFTPYRSEISVVGDLAGAIAGSRLWPFTIQRNGEEGGAMTMAMPSILTNPWNPIDGSNWIYDQALARATSDFGVIPDPWTGLNKPQRIESATVTVQEGLPVGATLDWVTLDFAPTIEVPGDAWVNWNGETQTFITASEMYTEAVTAVVKSVVTYRSDLADVYWHDGSPIDAADFLYFMIMTFDRGNPASAIYDPAAETSLNAFLGTFKGFKITSESPLVIEYYTDNWVADAENNVTSLWPIYGYGPGAWHNLTVGALAEGAGEIAYSQLKSDEIEKEWMSLISGPSIEVLATYLEQAAAENFIPYSPTLGMYITEEEATARWANLTEWFRTKGHFWIGTGPYYLERAFPVEGMVVLKNNTKFVDLSSRYAGLGKPPIAVVDITGPAEVAVGSEAAFDVLVSFDDMPYMNDDIISVNYLLFDATGALASKGAAEAVEDGYFTVNLSADETSKLVAGSTKLTIVVVSKLVSIPATESFEFVTSE